MLINLFTPMAEKVELNLKSIYLGHHATTYRGIEAIRCPFDYVIYQMILFEIKPDLVIELGTNSGGGALYIADLMNIIGNGIVHTIDIERYSKDIVAEHPRIKLFTEGWQGYDLSETTGYSTILVIDDASHMYKESYDALVKFAPLVSIGSYYIVEDGIINKLGLKNKYEGGPLRAIRQFMNQDDRFEVDRRWCDFFGKNATFNVNGYLKRIK
jgi:cephalosporin hydroxylase